MAILGGPHACFICTPAIHTITNAKQTMENIHSQKAPSVAAL
jgi:hypothetical protein